MSEESVWTPIFELLNAPVETYEDVLVTLAKPHAGLRRLRHEVESAVPALNKDAVPMLVALSATSKSSNIGSRERVADEIISFIEDERLGDFDKVLFHTRLVQLLSTPAVEYAAGATRLTRLKDRVVRSTSTDVQLTPLFAEEADNSKLNAVVVSHTVTVIQETADGDDERLVIDFDSQDLRELRDQLNQSLERVEQLERGLAGAGTFVWNISEEEDQNE